MDHPAILGLGRPQEAVVCAAVERAVVESADVALADFGEHERVDLAARARRHLRDPESIGDLGRGLFAATSGEHEAEQSEGRDRTNVSALTMHGRIVYHAGMKPSGRRLRPLVLTMFVPLILP